MFLIVVVIAKQLNRIEITDILNIYLKESIIIRHGNKASSFIRTLEHRQGLK